MNKDNLKEMKEDKKRVTKEDNLNAKSDMNLPLNNLMGTQYK